MTTQRKMNIQLLAAFILCIAGITLLIMGFWVPPVGEIHSSVLVAYGEVSTFAGGLFGVDIITDIRDSEILIIIIKIKIR